jgi:hypothetical protein
MSFHDQAIEGFQMLAFLICHLPDRHSGGTFAQDSHLPLVDADSAEFSGMIDSDHAFNKIGRRQVSWQAILARPFGMLFGRSHFIYRL